MWLDRSACAALKKQVAAEEKVNEADNDHSKVIVRYKVVTNRIVVDKADRKTVADNKVVNKIVTNVRRKIVVVSKVVIRISQISKEKVNQTGRRNKIVVSKADNNVNNVHRKIVAHNKASKAIPISPTSKEKDNRTGHRNKTAAGNSSIAPHKTVADNKASSSQTVSSRSLKKALTTTTKNNNDLIL